MPRLDVKLSCAEYNHLNQLYGKLNYMRQEDTDEIIRTSCCNMSCNNAASQTKARVDVVPLSPATRPATAVARRRRGEWGSPPESLRNQTEREYG